MIRLKKIAIVCHRWMGITFCLLFAWWFVSGIFMMYWDFPGVDRSDHLRHAPTLDIASVKVSPEQAFATLGKDQSPTSVRLAMFDGHPAYRFRVGFGESAVYADNGQPLDSFPQEMNIRTAAAWTHQPISAVKVEDVSSVDQWTLEGDVRRQLPLEKFSWPDGQQVYVSEETGEVVQYTTSSSRFFANLGPIPHWLYYTPLRKNGSLWSRVVIWCSGLASVAALFGLIVGFWMYSPSKRIPYTGTKRLHMILGLFFGIVACTWSFSGMLSMDPFPIQTERPTSARGKAEGASRVRNVLRGRALPLDRYSGKLPSQALAELGGFPVKEIEFSSFAGEPIYLASANPNETRIIPVHGSPVEEFDVGRLLSAVSDAARPVSIRQAELIHEYDRYYLDRRRQLPLPVLAVQFDDAAESRYYIDPKTAHIVGSHDSTTQAWIERWLYHGLHSLNFSWLYNYRPAWDVVVLILLLGGSLLSVTSVIIGYQLLRRKFSSRRTA